MKFKKLTTTCLPDVELILTPEEASVLQNIVGKIAGYSDNNSPRTFLGDLYDKLTNAGYRTVPYESPITWEGKKFQFTGSLRVDPK